MLRPLPRRLAPLAIVSATTALVVTALAVRAQADHPAASTAARAALTVVATTPQPAELAVSLGANGNIAPWQEALIGTEANGLRLVELRAGVGDVVRRGQVLAVFATETVQAELLQARAALGEAEALLAEAQANAQRARDLTPSGALSAQQVQQYLTAERTAQARVEAQKAMLRLAELRLRQTQVVAPDAGVISARHATVGAVMPAGTELFRLIRQGRLEWRAEVPAADLPRIRPGMGATLTLPTGGQVRGKVRAVGPTVDDRTRNALVYVDLAPAPAGTAAPRAGMYARGEFEVGRSPALTLPQTAVVLRDGFSYVLRIGADNKVVQTKVSVGRRVGDRIEVTGGLDPRARVVAAGGAFLADGDLVRVVAAAPAAAAAAASAAPATPATPAPAASR
ncbi:efflux RND transporter periplasmic adaptor subunit [Ideonella sp.]|uniref:efflux RND transporter periplasmic adaptor subunit n=1 Tax=Ideonella sp. TaxID=1929293 RepID=UPI0035ADB747